MIRNKLPGRTKLLAGYLLIAVIPAASTSLQAQDDLAVAEQQALYAAATAAAPSVVRIETFGGLEKVGSVLVNSGPTSGVIVGEDGYIISSAFNFIQQPTSILVTLPSGRRQAAEIVSRDHSRMLVLLKVDTDEQLDVPAAAPVDTVTVGQWSVTVGRTLPGDGFNVSAGIVSAKKRIWGKAIQTDANVSPANYGGALVDVQGQVLGVLVPLSPDSDSVVAGAEWYDSGIGFAIPLEYIYDNLSRLKEGDLYPGKLGISLKGNDLYGGAAIVGVTRPKSPAREAGLKADDKIVAINDVAVRRQADLKHALGPLLAGAEVRLEIVRGEDERFERQVVLTDKLEPYEHAFLGILPERADEANETTGVVVRYVYADSPAATAGLEVGDRVMRFGDEPLRDADHFRQLLGALEPGDEVSLVRERNGEEADLVLTAGKIDTEVPSELPDAFPAVDQVNEDLPQLGKINIKLPEEEGECEAYVPISYDPRFRHGLLVVLPVPGTEKVGDLVDAWREHCETSRTILLLPQAKDPRSWLPTETAFVRKTIENLRTVYRVDPERIVVHGSGSSGAMSFLVAFTHRDLIRGVSVVDAPVPARAPPIFNEPLQRLAVFVFQTPKSRLEKRIAANVQQLETGKFPVTLKTLGDDGKLDDVQRAGLLRWVDTLDRI